MENEKAKNVYTWLWLSPFLTIPTLIIILIADLGNELYCCDLAIEERITGIIAVLGSSLWHLVLLKSALNKDSYLIRWHGWQALILAGLRTAVPLFFMLVFGLNFGTLFFIPILMLIWLTGTLIGQHQAKHGYCTLASIFGLADKMPGPPEQPQAQTITEEKEIEDLVKILRFSSNTKARTDALFKLKEFGVVEDL